MQKASTPEDDRSSYATDSSASVASNSSEYRKSGARSVCPRIISLDVIRGIAVSSILLVNAPSILEVDAYTAPGHPVFVRHLLDIFVQERFFPIFSFLFGISFAIVLVGAMERSTRPRLVLFRRLLALALLGAVHQFLQPGEALLPYGLCGLVLLLPLSWVPRRMASWICAVVGVVLLLGALLLSGGGLTLVPGLIVLGYSVGLTDLIRRAETATKTNSIVLLVAAVVSVIGLVLSENNVDMRADTRFSAGLGLVMAIGYCSLVLLLLKTPIRPVLRSVFAPLGRMALTNYVSATVVIILAAPFFRAVGVGPATESGWWLLVLGCVVIIALQSVISAFWLRAFLYGPLEYLWRAVTWWKKPAFVRRDPIAK